MVERQSHPVRTALVRTAAVISASGLSGSALAAGACDVRSMQAAAPANTTITSATMRDTPVRHCKVEGYSITTNPGPNKVSFGLQLPEKASWNNRFYFIGVGGSGGGAVPSDASFAPRVAAGWATAGTDKGHPGVNDWSFNTDPAKALDNAHRGAHVNTVAAQALTKAYYGADRMYRYHTGCSGGGDMGIKAMQKYPQDYDGILLGWPGGRHPDPNRSGAPRVFYNMVREMVRESGSWISPAKRNFVHAKVVQACDMTDGARDELVWDHRLCKFDFSTLACNGPDNGQCLTPPEVRSFNNLLRNTTLPISNIDQWGLGSNPPPYNGLMPTRGDGTLGTVSGWAKVQLGQPNRDILKNPLTDGEVRQIALGQAKDGDTLPEGELEISRFDQAGGKALFYVGVGDWSNMANIYWFQDLLKQEGAARVQRAARMYQIPGWGHCGGGNGPTDGPDRMLAALIDWVERGKAPEGIVMHRGADREQPLFPSMVLATVSTETGAAVRTTAGASRDFLVCPFPMVSVFDRSKAAVPGAVFDARNWTCKPSPNILGSRSPKERG